MKKNFLLNAIYCNGLFAQCQDSLLRLQVTSATLSRFNIKCKANQVQMFVANCKIIHLITALFDNPAKSGAHKRTNLIISLQGIVRRVLISKDYTLQSVDDTREEDSL